MPRSGPDAVCGPNAELVNDRVKLLFHRLVARRLGQDPTLVDLARQELARQRTRAADRTCFAEWDELLRLDVGILRRELVRRDQRMTRLRLSSPFASVVDIRDPVLDGTVEVDGCYVGGQVRPENLKADRKDRRLADNQNGKRRCVVVMRERGGRTLPFALMSEAEGAPLVVKKVAKGAVVHADEAGSWDDLHARFEMKRINHQVGYSMDGACTNQAESYFSRLRRAEWGQHHHLGGLYLGRYAAEMAWREDHRRVANGGLVNRLTGLVLSQPVSVDWCGYWQRNAA